jgi:hypothetical protein
MKIIQATAYKKFEGLREYRIIHAENDKDFFTARQFKDGEDYCWSHYFSKTRPDAEDASLEDFWKRSKELFADAKREEQRLETIRNQPAQL